MANEISNSDDCLDVRDIIARFEEMEAERRELTDAVDQGAPSQAEANAALREWDEDNGDELKALRALLEDLKGNGGDHDWEGAWYPVTLIRDSYFVDYAEELVKDIADMPRDIPAYIVIDWEATAENIRQDYSSADYDGETYWYR